MDRTCETCKYSMYLEDEDRYTCGNIKSEYWGQEVRLGEKCNAYKNEYQRQYKVRKHKGRV